MRLLILTLAAALAACGGTETETETVETCSVVRAAYVVNPCKDDMTCADDVPLTGPEHTGLTDDELGEIGFLYAARLGVDPGWVVVGPYAFCRSVVMELSS